MGVALDARSGVVFRNVASGRRHAPSDNTADRAEHDIDNRQTTRARERNLVKTGHRSQRFRPDLEGLRAVAVILVLLYHAKLPGFAGGYIGVDVFFVLSGFLITGVLYRELRSTQSLSISRFYARRARRLLPAAGAVLLCTLAASIWLVPGFRLAAVTTDITSAALYVSNMRFGVQANDYFQATAAPSPVLHFWSLSVEEQFYIFWPAVLIFLHNWLPDVRSPRARVAGGILAVGGASLVGSLVLTTVNQPWAFFLLPTRAWELAIGGVLAVLARRLVFVPRRLAAGATVAGLACVIAAGVLFDDGTPFPGIAATLPVAGAALVIVGGFPDPAPPPSRILSLRPCRFLGRISYSLYLWHWPILVFGLLILGPAWSIPLAMAAIPVAAISQRWIEEPFRHGRIIGITPSRNLLQAAGVGLVVVAVCWAVSPSAGATVAGAVPGIVSNPVATLLPSAAAAGPPGVSPSAAMPRSTSPAKDNPPVPCSGCTLADLIPPPGSNLLAGRIDDSCVDFDPARCVLGTALGADAVVAVFGDSHAANWTPALEQLAIDRKWRLVVMTHASCPPELTTVWSYRFKRPDTECDAWREQALSRLAAERPAVILIASYPAYALVAADGGRVTYPDDANWAKMWSSGLAATLTRLAPLQSTLVVMGDVPVVGDSGLNPACISQHATDFQSCRAPRDRVVRTGVRDVERSAATSNRALFVDPTPWLCDRDSCPAVIARYVVYADAASHLTAPFALSLSGRLVAAIPFPK
jgi:peptidoglycan/LPS O-acetylase OafA/YrhL